MTSPRRSPLPAILFAALLSALVPPSARARDEAPVAAFAGQGGGSPVTLGGSLAVNHRVALRLQGPPTAENGIPSPFLDRAMDVTFVHAQTGARYRVPGFFAADGDAAETGATSGDVWMAYLTPALAGTWTWRLSFRSGVNVAVSPYGSGAPLLPFHGLQGSFEVQPLDLATEPSVLRRDGRLVLDGGHHLRHQGSGRPWIQTGVNSPENLLAYAGFDQSPDAEHQYLPHLSDWSPGDPTWHDGQQGQGLIGALNYLASVGVNTMSMLVFNVGGDGHDVWPFTSKFNRLQYDVSKLAQWELVFEHMDELGISPHLVLQEQENDNGPSALDGGELGLQRRLFHRELLARFGHHLGLVINLGEENQNTTAQQVAFDQHLTSLDAYTHPIVVHTFPTSIELVYSSLLEEGALEGASLQVADIVDVHQTTLDVRTWSHEAGLPWVVNLDEIGPPENGVLPDSEDFWHDGPRVQALWGNLMGGGGGVQWYFGYGWDHDDISLEDFRSRDNMYRMSTAARTFLEALPFEQMEPAEQLVTAGEAWVLAKPGEAYALYLPEGGGLTLELDEPQSSWSARWFDPRKGIGQVDGAVLVHLPDQPLSLEAPGAGPGQDWALSLERLGQAPVMSNAIIGPTPFTGGDLVIGATVLDADQDVVSVMGHVFDPHGAWISALHLTPQGDGRWLISLPDLGAIPPGTWTCLLVASDAMGHVAWAAPTLQAL